MLLEDSQFIQGFIARGSSSVLALLRSRSVLMWHEISFPLSSSADHVKEGVLQIL